ncbi:MAG: outer membrane beta-barrel protein [Gemmatimonadota bacterium]|nr:MAG: outer membrane beta-barrel protein [Gemmatimonadota bacterium]
MLAALFVALVATPSLAQMDLTAGVKAGVDFANLGADTDQLIGVSPDSKFGFSFGGFFGIQLHEYFMVQADGQYVQKGASFSEAGDEIDANVDYIEFMFPATLTIPTQGNITPRVYAGPAIAFEVGCNISGEEGGASIEIDCETFGVETKSVDFGLFFGGGIDVSVGSGAVMLDVLYNLGLTNVNDTPGEEDFDVTNQNIQIVAGYKFFFGG